MAASPCATSVTLYDQTSPNIYFCLNSSIGGRKRPAELRWRRCATTPAFHYKKDAASAVCDKTGGGWISVMAEKSNEGSGAGVLREGNAHNKQDQ